MDYYNPDQLTIVLLGSEASRMWRAQVGQQGIAAAVQANVGEDGRTALPEQGVTSASGDNEERGKRPVPKAGHGRALQRFALYDETACDRCEVLVGSGLISLCSDPVEGDPPSCPPFLSLWSLSSRAQNRLKIARAAFAAVPPVSEHKIREDGTCPAPPLPKATLTFLHLQDTGLSLSLFGPAMAAPSAQSLSSRAQNRLKTARAAFAAVPPVSEHKIREDGTCPAPPLPKATLTFLHLQDTGLSLSLFGPAMAAPSAQVLFPGPFFVSAQRTLLHPAL
ncbi:hypothetical protein TREES_T100012869 [Tupaia chinensis]|uniref:Uncharacterized protein n=1 Tax=Tupaia chinensis TaxID=246437 RepID=L9LAN8_TUPCH|nr:hypothetical protein TREES_T100012869 [Tupaia chinensis]